MSKPLGDPDCENCHGEGTHICSSCNGSGEGAVEWVRCSSCKGDGEVFCECTDQDNDDDYDPPEESEEEDRW